MATLKGFWQFLNTDVKDIPWDELADKGIETVSANNDLGETWEEHKSDLSQLVGGSVTMRRKPSAMGSRQKYREKANASSWIAAAGNRKWVNPSVVITTGGIAIRTG